MRIIRVASSRTMVINAINQLVEPGYLRQLVNDYFPDEDGWITLERYIGVTQDYQLAAQLFISRDKLSYDETNKLLNKVYHVDALRELKDHLVSNEEEGEHTQDYLRTIGHMEDDLDV